MASKNSFAGVSRSGRGLWIVLAASALVAVVGSLWLRSNAVELGATGYDFAEALFSACNFKDSSKVEKLEAMVLTAKEESAISEREFQRLISIIDQAKSERWVQATKSLKSLMNQQMVPNESLPELD